MVLGSRFDHAAGFWSGRYYAAMLINGIGFFGQVVANPDFRTTAQQGTIPPDYSGWTDGVGNPWTVAGDGWSYTIGGPNRSPVAALTANPNQGEAPLTVSLDATGFHRSRRALPHLRLGPQRRRTVRRRRRHLRSRPPTPQVPTTPRCGWTTDMAARTPPRSRSPSPRRRPEASATSNCLASPAPGCRRPTPPPSTSPATSICAPMSPSTTGPLPTPSWCRSSRAPTSSCSTGPRDSSGSGSPAPSAGRRR